MEGIVTLAQPDHSLNTKLLVISTSSKHYFQWLLGKTNLEKYRVALRYPQAD